MGALIALSCAASPFGNVVVDHALLSEDGRVVTVSVIGAPPPGQSATCSATYQASYEVREAVLEVLVTERPLTRAGSCTLPEQICCTHELQIELEQPFSVHTLRNRTRVSSTLLLLRPAGLVELVGLPEGWSLREEGSDWSPDGLWTRVYSPLEAPPPAGRGRLELDQLFGGEFGREPEYAQPPATVNGQAAEVHLYPELTEITLAWRVGGYVLRLYGDTRDFTLEGLVAIAEAAVPAPN